MAQPRAEFRVTAENDTDRTLRQVRGQLRDLSDQAKRVGGTLGRIGGVAVAAGGGLAFLAERSLNSTQQLVQLSKQTGFSVERLQTLRQTAEQYGGDQGRVNNAVADFSERIQEAREGTGEATEGLELLERATGRQIDLNQRAGAVFLEVAEAFRDVDSASTRASIAARLGGDAFRDLIPTVLELEQGLRAQEEQALASGRVMRTDTAEGAAAAAREIDRLKQIVIGNFQRVIADLGPDIRDFTTELAENPDKVRDFANEVANLAGHLDDAAEGTVKALDRLEDFIGLVGSGFSGAESQAVERAQRMREEGTFRPFAREEGPVFPERTGDEGEPIRAQLQDLRQERDRLLENLPRSPFPDQLRDRLDEVLAQMTELQRRRDALSAQDALAQTQAQMRMRSFELGLGFSGTDIAAGLGGPDLPPAGQPSGGGPTFGVGGEGGGGGESDRTDAIQKTIQSLEEEAATLNQTRQATALYRLEQQGASEAQKDRARDLLDLISAQERATEQAQAAEERAEQQAEAERRLEARIQSEADAVKDRIEPVRRYRAEMGRLTRMYQAGALSAEQYEKATQGVVDRMRESRGEAQETEKALSQFAVSARRSIQSEFADTLNRTAQGRFDGLLDSWSRTISQMINEAASAKLLETLFGSGQGFGTGSDGGLLSDLVGGVAGFFGSASGGGATASARGNVFADGELQALANGGVVHGPTVFPMRRGAGIMGEAGPEAVLPLERNRRGELGVKAGGGEGVTVQITQRFEGAADPEQVRRSGAQAGKAAARALDRAQRRNL